MKTLILGLNLLANIAWAADLSPLKTREVSLSILTDSKGMTAYVFDNDVGGVPTCYDGCAGIWPPINAPEGEFKAPLSVVIRKDGSRQFAYKGRPLYLYADDEKPGDISGDGLKSIWHVVHP